MAHYRKPLDIDSGVDDSGCFYVRKRAASYEDDTRGSTDESQSACGGRASGRAADRSRVGRMRFAAQDLEADEARSQGVQGALAGDSTVEQMGTGGCYRSA
jgi:hypothetical protein